MKLKGQACKSCGSEKYGITYKYGLFLHGLKCKNCKKRYNIRGILPLMSTKHVDVMFKVVLILIMIFYLYHKFPFGAAYMLVIMLVCNYLIYPLMFKFGMLILEKEGKNWKRNLKS